MIYLISFYFVSASFFYKEWIYLFDCYVQRSSKKGKERRSFFHARLISDLKIYLQVPFFLFILTMYMYFNIEKLFGPCTFFLCENLFHMFSQFSISFPSIGLFTFRKRLVRERKNEGEWKTERNIFLSYKSFSFSSLIYFIVKFKLQT